jgi:N-dimethylarginine dimethylaminohydrolase
MVAPLKHVVVKRPEDAFRSADAIETEWQDLDYLRPPSLQLAVQHHGVFVALISQLGAQVSYLPADDRTNLDSLYVHDPVLTTERGIIILQTGKPLRRGEGPAFEDALRSWDIPVWGRLDGDATAEGGDTLWLDRHTLLVARGFRTNNAGIARLRELLQPLEVQVMAYDLPYWNGPREVLHLQSFISLLDDDLALIYRRLLPVAMYALLGERGIRLIEVPDSEYDSLGCNVLAIAPRTAVIVAGNPITRSRIEAAGCKVSEFDGSEICLPGSGGPTCLTRPLVRG